MLMRSISAGSFWVAASVLVLLTVTPVRADEIFVCDDHSVLYVNSTNRAALSEHPCVKSWFERNQVRSARQRGGATATLPNAVADTSAAETAEPAAAQASTENKSKAAGVGSTVRAITKGSSGRRRSF